MLTALLTAPADAVPCLVLCSPIGPGTPFQGWMMLWDPLRLLCVLGGIAVVVLTPRCIVRASNHPGQWSRFAALGAFCLSAISTEYTRLGDYASARLAWNLLGVAFALYGVVHYLRTERPTP